MKLTQRAALYIGYVWPETESSAAGARSLWWVNLLQEMGYRVIYTSTAHDHPSRLRLENQGVETKFIELNDSSFDCWIKSLNPELVFFDRYIVEEQFSWRVKDSCPKALRFIDTQDLHFLRNARAQALDQNISLNRVFDGDLDYLDLLPNETLRELASIYRSDLSFLMSEFEERLLIERFGVDPKLMRTVGFGEDLDLKTEKAVLPQFSERRDFVMIGNFRHPPNVDSVYWLKESIWPAIKRALPDVSVHIYGAYPLKEVMSLSDPSMGFWVKGSCENAHETLRQYRVLLAPLRYGAGQKGKIIDSWKAGTPVVTTPMGSEGMRFEPQLCFESVCKSAEELSAQAIAIYQNQKIWECLQKEGFKTLKTHFNQSQVTRKAKQAIELKTAERLEHSSQKQNWLSELLWTESYLSKKYLSRWIEEKNRRD